MESSSGKKFNFPYEKPYQVQLDLMEAIQNMLRNEDHKVGLFESPTGTGKSLSMLCSILSNHLGLTEVSSLGADWLSSFG